MKIRYNEDEEQILLTNNQDDEEQYDTKVYKEKNNESLENKTQIGSK